MYIVFRGSVDVLNVRRTRRLGLALLELLLHVLPVVLLLLVVPILALLLQHRRRRHGSNCKRLRRW